MSEECCSGHISGVPSVHQTLDEMAFERGIWSAAMDGNVEKLKHFLSKGVDPSICDPSGYTALHYAARHGKETACKILLSHRANPNAQTHGGATPLLRAAYVGHTNIISLLLQYNADPSISDSDGKTPLHKAAEGQRFAAANILVTVRPELKSITDKRGLTPMQYVDTKNTELLKLLCV
ncbi:Ankyrin repeat domain-containing protein 39, partial [Stegodyphus mimosarum]